MAMSLNQNENGTHRRSAGDIAARLRERIVTAQYARHERLPAERHLSEEFGVARGTLREALRQLEETGFLERRAGSGSYVTYDAGGLGESVTDTTSPLQLIDARVALEPQMVRLAVLHATERGIAALEAALGALEGCNGDSRVFGRADEAFHMALAECTQNPLLIAFARHVNEVRGHAQWSQMREQTLSVAVIDHYNRQHREVFEAIASRSAERGATAMKAHLATARGSLVEAASS